MELESSTTGPIVDKAKIQDSKIYGVLDKLRDKGLASYVIKNNVRRYRASDPEMLLKLISERQQALQNQKQELIEKVIPEIEQRKKLTEEKQEATVYESMACLKAAFIDMLDTMEPGDEYQVLSFNQRLGTPPLVNFFREHHKRRKNKKIRVRLIANEVSRQVLTEGHSSIINCTRFTKKKFPIGVYIFSNCIMTLTWGSRPTAFLIKSKANHDAYKDFFEELWSEACE